ncbi:type III-B CRISPR module-associated Cmr3 family protein [Thermoactinomyces sp. CICC 10523]|uniref:type III-B CRISPR module-associated Cmr3 family protein n=1 Tax=Thermoactinomyces sp. CICC 10523 TaxID=2767428 RepID=UPI0018DB2A74|nr:type III-B CRISPR module-associated Cmr3 family protein [Thermoactinomyces sp. CICC 10523]MBH8599290.1 hypothetical protein [Thermoactinomyces sp. CICC 10523]
MNRWIWAFRALDTFFFRDGTPFHAEEPGVAPQGVFPPPIFTLQGAIRAAMAHWKSGWAPGKDWPEELGKSEEKGLTEAEKRRRWAMPDDLGQLRLVGPYLRINGKKFYPAPLILIGRKKQEEMKADWELTRLVPDCFVHASDLGKDVFFPVPEKIIPNGRLVEGWLDREGMEAVLSGKVPAAAGSILLPEEKWKPERRVGIKRNRQTRTAEQSYLYTLTHVRPDREVEVVVEVSGLGEKWQPTGAQVIPLGGEGRLAEVTVESAKGDSDFPRMPDSFSVQGDTLRFTVSLLTPARYVDMEQAVRHGPPEIRVALESARCVSASIGKAIQVGGWNVKVNWPRTLLSFLPAGSTWFYEAPLRESAKLFELHGTLTGELQSYGLGQIVIGTWNKGGESI